jgi:hypothetical protein
MTKHNLDVIDRLLFTIQDDGCWPYAKSIDYSRGGYGSIKIDGRSIGAHRAMYERLYGPIPEGLHVLHDCDNPACINPDHLFLGTNADNMADREAKGRSYRIPLEENARTLEREVWEILYGNKTAY